MFEFKKFLRAYFPRRGNKMGLTIRSLLYESTQNHTSNHLLHFKTFGGILLTLSRLLSTKKSQSFFGYKKMIVLRVLTVDSLIQQLPHNSAEPFLGPMRAEVHQLHRPKRKMRQHYYFR